MAKKRPQEGPTEKASPKNWPSQPDPRKIQIPLLQKKAATGPPPRGRPFFVRVLSLVLGLAGPAVPQVSTLSHRRPVALAPLSSSVIPRIRGFLGCGGGGILPVFFL